ncbi:uncharacterized protein N7503_000439 [Penicillium pulvis]|uniref:uncharacterized protein n=1 Tax=Penicillium pulvis TaxID=1562058 RepID=UPI00254860B4|nr:uncharacterized protein N7503_000439 [Penicillium pulvis]KAJ5813689.1 hypothetical protein N7503_000439 [Penicillium pulvis]
MTECPGRKHRNGNKVPFTGRIPADKLRTGHFTNIGLQVWDHPVEYFSRAMDGDVVQIAPTTNVGGVLADIWTPKYRALAVTMYALTLVSPVISPFMGGAIGVTNLDLEWTEYITGMIMALSCILGIVFLGGSFPPALLVYKSRQFRLRSGDWALHVQHEDWDATLTIIDTDMFCCRSIRVFCVRHPLPQFSFIPDRVSRAPQLECASRSFAISSPSRRHLTWYCGQYRQSDILQSAISGKQQSPRSRSPTCTHNDRFNIFCCGLAPFDVLYQQDLDFFTIFQAAWNYLIDTFQRYSASAVAVNTFLPSILAGCFPLIAYAMSRKLGTPCAFSLLGFIAVALILIPFLLYVYGPRIRAKGKWSKASI